ncbi:MAG: fibronectin type III domain-containing protein [Flagellimonas sp.]
MRTLFTEKSTKKQSAGHCIRAYGSLLRVQLLNCPLRHCLLRHSLLLCCLLFCCQLSTAQSFPVQVIAQATPSTPTNFSDFANASALNGPLRVQLVLNDFQISDRKVRLQVAFNGNGIGFQSRENVIGTTPLYLEGGIPTVLDHTLLAPYFEFGNLTGIPPNVYGSPIPDGVYQVCFQVFDVLTGKRLSNNACTTINVFKNSPPILVLPENGSDIVERSPQNIMFQWTPRHINVSQVEYELSLVEIWDNAMDPQAAFLGSTPLFTTTISATVYVYGPGDPILLPNRTYAWRVQARPKPGAGEVGGFLNQGYSQIFSFTNIEGCYVPNGIYHEVRGANQANIFWEDNSTSVPQFRVRYRARGNGNAWFYNQTTANWTTLWDLQADTAYEYQLKKTCAVAESDWSPLRQFTTNLETEEEDLYQCGVSPDVGITNQDPLPQLSVGESFTAGDFQVVATEVNGGNGYFTGRGYTRLPYLSNIKLAVHFTNILVNTDRQLAQGTVITAFDPTMRNIVNTGEVVQTVGELGDAVGELASSIRELLQNFTGTPEQIEQLETENEQQESYVEELLADESIPQNVRNELAANHNAYNASSLDLINEATQGGPNPEGYNTAAQLDTFNQLNESIEKAESYRSEEISDVVKIDELIAFIKSNLTARKHQVDYKKKDYYIRNILLEDHKMEHTIDGQQVGIYVSLKKSGKINLSIDEEGNYDGVVLRIDPDDMFHTGFYLDFTYVDSNESAITIWTKSFLEFELLLREFGFVFDLDYAKEIYNEAIASANGDCNDLDVVYETIPPDVAKYIGNEQLYQDFLSLVNCNISAPFTLYDNTNENLSVINILNAFDKDYIYGQIISEPELFKELFKKIDAAYLPDYIKSLTQIGLAHWTTEEIEQSPAFLLKPIDFYNELNPQHLETRVVSYCGYQESSNQYEVGYVVHRYDGYPAIAPSETTDKSYGFYGVFAPVHTKWQGESLLMPAMAAGHFTEELVAADNSTILNNIATVLLPEFAGLSLKSLKWLDDIVPRIPIQLTKRTFGHTFTIHGEDMTNFLINRAKGSGLPQGQFLDNQKAAQFILDNIKKTANGAIDIPIPKGFPARVIMPSGKFKTPTHIKLVPGGGGVKTAFPLIP